MTKDKEWKRYEIAASEIFTELFPGARVVHNDKITGVETGAARQIDTSIRFEIGGVPFLVIIQAKNHSRPIDIVKIGEFLSIIDDVRANKGIIVCNAGFSKKAKNYARNRGIQLVSIEGFLNDEIDKPLTAPIFLQKNFVCCEFHNTLELEKGDQLDLNPIKHIFKHSEYGEITVSELIQIAIDTNLFDLKKTQPQDLLTGFQPFQIGVLRKEEIVYVNAINCRLVLQNTTRWFRSEIDITKYSGMTDWVTKEMKIAKVELPPIIVEKLDWIECALPNNDDLSGPIVISIEVKASE